MTEPFATREEETRGMAIVGMSLSVGVLSLMRGAGLVSQQGINVRVPVMPPVYSEIMPPGIPC